MNDKLTQREGWLTREEVEGHLRWLDIQADEDAIEKRKALCRMALYALNGPPAVDWMPIESAPKDGTWVMGWWSVCSTPVVMRWEQDYEEHPDWAHVPQKEGWRSVGDDCIPTNQEHCTHWLPLPPAPTDHKEPRAL